MNHSDTLKFVIVGHVDHGKSTLIGRLFYDTDCLPPDKVEEIEKTSKELGREVEFAFLLDHLQEEREQGITIDTAQTFFKTEKRKYVIIDAPGHVEFVKNMITGASQAEAAILIVDALEGVKEQTRRHAYILSLLGLDQVIVIINKMDAVNYDENRFNTVKNDVEKFLESINIKAKYYLPISALKGDNVAKKSENMKWYQGVTVLESLDSLKNKPPAEDKPLIFPIQDVYKIDGKRINVGRVEAGIIEKGQIIKILPTGQVTRVKSIEKFMENTDRSVAGESTGFTTEDPVFLERGHVVCLPGNEPYLTDTFKANVFWMFRKPLDINEKITLKCATQEVSCRVQSIEKRMNSSTLELLERNATILENLEVGEVIIKTKHPIAVKTFNEVQELGRFVLERDQLTCAGGIITEIL
ncbi:sulfate adenylyltransferase subunit 1 [Calderihabitans maritimus]|uniref:sulfate adenylyltransferase n=1 Tax=Calderihabitans maritimus TaxID=1246530 RepID=A0A1Z5HX01_9FIRM|nr:GTP-binding protein [Calderihabitans maritimus]GAW94063.1 sulfate adenylyltransferase, subunit 1 [Calderihabitans maritimus]